jgi:hypothetical protein
MVKKLEKFMENTNKEAIWGEKEEKAEWEEKQQYNHD